MILLTAYAEWKSAKEAIRLGALDYFEKGQEPDELYHRIDKALAARACGARTITCARSSGAVQPPRRDRTIRGDAKRARARRPRGADDATLLIQGESGTGKEVIARALHDGGTRADEPVHHRELWSLARGADGESSSSATKGRLHGRQPRKDGLVRAAQGGTLFLDEVGELPPPLQVKLLRVLQERKVRPVGGHQELDVEVRVVAATHRDVEQPYSREPFGRTSSIDSM